MCACVFVCVLQVINRSWISSSPTLCSAVVDQVLVQVLVPRLPGFSSTSLMSLQGGPAWPGRHKASIIQPDCSVQFLCFQRWTLCISCKIFFLLFLLLPSGSTCQLSHSVVLSPNWSLLILVSKSPQYALPYRHRDTSPGQQDALNLLLFLFIFSHLSFFWYCGPSTSTHKHTLCRSINCGWILNYWHKLLVWTHSPTPFIGFKRVRQWQTGHAEGECWPNTDWSPPATCQWLTNKKKWNNMTRPEEL